MNMSPQPPASAVARLLTEAGLPSSDLTAAHLKNFFGCGSTRAPDGIVGVELYDSVALLRSLAVSASCRGRGCGTALVAQAERFAQSQGAKDIYLLTTTAERFFERLGYARIQREAAPLAIQRTQEFSTLCSSSASLMAKRLPANPLVQIKPLGFPWETTDPFLTCVYHEDAYPQANAQMGPKASLAGRALGQDFSRKGGWSMYHGTTVPGFPAHPHRGFETVTIVRKGLVDHSDSLGAAARYGRGDVQWLTAGKGVVHSEMFPLLDTAGPNPLELFQIWLNLPAAAKMSAPYFTMFWSDDIPRRVARDGRDRTVEVTVIAGRLHDAGTGTMDADGNAPLAPPPDSWAARADADVAIWTIRMAPGARWTLPAATGVGTRRSLYFFKGRSVSIAGQDVSSPAAIELLANVAVEAMNGDEASEFLLLQGKPIGEPVAQHGPFVMNTQAEIAQAFSEYRRTQFGGWPWPDAAPVHGPDPARFARHPDGREERPKAGAQSQKA